MGWNINKRWMMPGLFSKPSEFVPGNRSPLSAGALNKILSATSRQVIGGTPVSMFGDRVVLNRNQEVVARRKQAAPFRVVSEDFDWLLCVPWIPIGTLYAHDSTLNSDSATFDTSQYVYVAKPRLLQRAPFDGKVVTFLEGYTETYVYDEEVFSYRKTYGSPYGEYVDEYLSPDYFTGDLIWAIRGVTGLMEPTNPLLVFPGVILSPVELGISFDIELLYTIGIGAFLKIEWESIPDVLGNVTKYTMQVEVVSVDLVTGVVVVSVVNPTQNLPVVSTLVGLSLEVPIVWEDINEGARKWLTGGAPIYSFFKLVSLSPYFDKYYLAIYQISQATETGDIVWQDVASDVYKYAFVELINLTTPNSDLDTVYVGFPTKGDIRKLTHPVHGDLWLYDVLYYSNLCKIPVVIQIEGGDNASGHDWTALQQVVGTPNTWQPDAAGYTNVSTGVKMYELNENDVGAGPVRYLGHYDICRQVAFFLFSLSELTGRVIVMFLESSPSIGDLYSAKIYTENVSSGTGLVEWVAGSEVYAFPINANLIPTLETKYFARRSDGEEIVNSRLVYTVDRCCDAPIDQSSSGGTDNCLCLFPEIMTATLDDGSLTPQEYTITMSGGGNSTQQEWEGGGTYNWGTGHSCTIAIYLVCVANPPAGTRSILASVTFSACDETPPITDAVSFVRECDDPNGLYFNNSSWETGGGFELSIG
jgi:hypothetical protein